MCKFALTNVNNELGVPGVKVLEESAVGRSAVGEEPVKSNNENTHLAADMASALSKVECVRSPKARCTVLHGIFERIANKAKSVNDHKHWWTILQLSKIADDLCGMTGAPLPSDSPPQNRNRLPTTDGIYQPYASQTTVSQADKYKADPAEVSPELNVNSTDRESHSFSQ